LFQEQLPPFDFLGVPDISRDRLIRECLAGKWLSRRTSLETSHCRAHTAYK